jgi:predicted small lipoprotein YifL
MARNMALKIIILHLAALAVVALLHGCGKADPTNVPPNSVEFTPVQVTPSGIVIYMRRYRDPSTGICYLIFHDNQGFEVVETVCAED